MLYTIWAELRIKPMAIRCERYPANLGLKRGCKTAAANQMLRRQFVDSTHNK